MNNNIFDIGIIGGGLAGLSLAIQAVDNGFSVILFEKETYPFHKVCGEYISMESWNFIEKLGIPLSDLKLPIINKLTVTAPNGKTINQALPLGGFGISRFTLDNLLKNIAIAKGVEVHENTKVDHVEFVNNEFAISATSNLFNCKVCCGSFGKRSNIDVKWKRTFTLKKPSSINNYIGVKYHIKSNFKKDTIALHNFENGYCGISKIENDLYCLCYLTTAENLKNNGNIIMQMEENVLFKNKQLKQIFEQANIIYEKPVTISQISFDKKTQVENHVLFIGDAAGMITPLCGNGMSMAMHGSKIAFENIKLFLNNNISRIQMENYYTKQWRKQFSFRLKVGRIIQSMFGKNFTTNLLIVSLKKMPWLVKKIISLTHGKPY